MTNTHRSAVRTSLASLLALFFLLAAAGTAQDTRLPRGEDSIRFAVIGDSGTGDREQYEVAAQMVEARKRFPFEFVLMLGDNLYGSEDPDDYEEKFERPYKPLLDAGVKFYASLGNHDERSQRFYEHFNMGGELYYTFEKNGARFFALESDYMDRAQIEWITKELSRSDEGWKIAFFHHPLYSSGRRHGSDLALREVLEPLFVEHGVDVVFAGHEHFYERIHPQKGIAYFTSGGAGKLRRGNIREGALTAAGFDQDRHFMLVEIAEDDLFFEAISRTGEIVDSGAVRRREAAELTPAGVTAPAADRPARSVAPERALPAPSRP